VVYPNHHQLQYDLVDEWVDHLVEVVIGVDIIHQVVDHIIVPEEVQVHHEEIVNVHEVVGHTILITASRIIDRIIKRGMVN